MKYEIQKHIVIGVLFAISLSAGSYAQTTVATGEPKTYAARRTVGIEDPKAPRVFEDVTVNTPLKDFRCISGSKEKDFIVETTACTVAVFDYDNDKKPDIYLLNGSTIEAENGKAPAPRSALFRNLGNWKFENVTNAAGVPNERWGMGVSIGDYNGDGFADIFVSNFGTSRLYKNNGNGTFTDVAKDVGLDVVGWHTGATFGDYDNDGRQDLFIPAYLDFDLNDLPPPPSDKSGSGSSFCQFRGIEVMCGPRGLRGAKDRLFHQGLDGKFEEVGDKANVRDEDKYFGFSSVFVDVDDDNDLDLLVINDSTPKQLYENKGDGTFEDIGYPSGIALNENGREQAGMGVAVGDIDNDGRVDFYITNFSDDSNTLYRNDGVGDFTDITFRAGLGEPTVPFLGWGTAFFDYDNDGWKDLIVANGHVYPVVDDFEWGTSYAQQMLLFRNSIEPGSKMNKIKFERVPAAPESGLSKASNARGLAIADFDLDGKLDVIVNNMDAAPSLLRNVSENKSNWLSIRLEAKTLKGFSSVAVGAKVFVTVGGKTQRFDVVSGGSYASQNDQTIHFGLGDALKIDKLQIVWPDGSKEEFSGPKLNTRLDLRQRTPK